MTTPFAEWVGRGEIQRDTVDPTRVAQALALLDLPRAKAVPGAPLPPLFHLFFANEVVPQGELAGDGHARLGRFMPPIDGHGAVKRRMWAAGDIRFEGTIKVGENLERRSVITAIESKAGRSGPLLFVVVERTLSSPSGRVVEERTVVYRTLPDAPAAESVDLAPDTALSPRDTWLPDERALFRFSALTWNSHRIHYDRAFCQVEERYPDLLVHGPFTALKLALLAAQGKAGIRRFAFRGLQALYVNRPVTLVADEAATQLQALNHRGQLAMAARVEYLT